MRLERLVNPSGPTELTPGYASTYASQRICHTDLVYCAKSQEHPLSYTTSNALRQTYFHKHFIKLTRSSSLASACGQICTKYVCNMQDDSPFCLEVVISLS